MDTLVIPTTLDREALAASYRANRARSAEIFGIVDPGSYYVAPIPLRHPFVFYIGHIPAFSYRTLNRLGLKQGNLDPHFDVLFERGIDPDTVDEAKTLQTRNPWPTLDEVHAYAKRADDAVLAAIASARLEDPNVPELVRGEAVFNILEHEEMHHETLLYIVSRLPYENKHANGRRSIAPDAPPLATGAVHIPAGTATLGADRDSIPFGWDIEFERTTVDVGAFSVDVNAVTNAEYLAFMDATEAPAPSFWTRRDGDWYWVGQFELVPLPPQWPAYVTLREARAYAAWKGGRVMTEPEYQRAAYGTPEGIERLQPWGDAAPTSAHGNFDFRRFDPEPVGITAAGASAWGIYDLVGNGWEWTDTEFAPLPGYRSMATYLPYSSDFFDGKHYVVKGASPVTSRNLVRRSFRNWYRDDYPYVYAKFRVAFD